MNRLFLLTLFGFCLITACDKDKFEGGLLNNASFEDSEVMASKAPDGWIDCGVPSESPPDVFGSGPGNPFDVTNVAQEGDKYLGMVVRDNGTRECLMQNFDAGSKKGDFKIELVVGRSDTYSSVSQTTGLEADFNNPVILEIYGLVENGPDELLYVSEANESTEWVTLIEEVTVNQKINGIKITPNYIGEEYYNGNILIDVFIFSKL